MTDPATARLVAQFELKYALESKFCPACGSKWLGGVMGDRTILGCCGCGQRVPKLLSDVGDNPRHDEPIPAVVSRIRAYTEPLRAETPEAMTHNKERDQSGA